MPSLDECYPELVRILTRDEPASAEAATGLSGWEAVVQAALSNGRDRKRADKVIAALDQEGMLEPEGLARVAITEIVDSLAAAGVWVSAKDAALLRRLADWYGAAYSNDARSSDAGSPSTEELRATLRAVKGVGAAKADAILLALGRPCVPIDQGIYRILIRHGWCDITSDYDEASDCLCRHARGDTDAIERTWRSLSRLGREYCAVRAPKCDRCPLKPLLPDSGPIDPHG